MQQTDFVLGWILIVIVYASLCNISHLRAIYLRKVDVFVFWMDCVDVVSFFKNI